MHDALEERQATDQAGHPEHGRRGHHDAGAASQRTKPEPQGRMSETARGRESRRGAQTARRSPPPLPTHAGHGPAARAAAVGPRAAIATPAARAAPHTRTPLTA